MGTHGRARAARRRSRHRHPRLTRTLGTSHERRQHQAGAPSAPSRLRLRRGSAAAISGSGSARAAPAPACRRVERPRRRSPRSVSSRRAAARRLLRSAPPAAAPAPLRLQIGSDSGRRLRLSGFRLGCSGCSGCSGFPRAPRTECCSCRLAVARRPSPHAAAPSAPMRLRRVCSRSAGVRRGGAENARRSGCQLRTARSAPGSSYLGAQPTADSTLVTCRVTATVRGDGGCFWNDLALRTRSREKPSGGQIPANRPVGTRRGTPNQPFCSPGAPLPLDSPAPAPHRPRAPLGMPQGEAHAIHRRVGAHGDTVCECYPRPPTQPGECATAATGSRPAAMGGECAAAQPG